MGEIIDAAVGAAMLFALLFAGSWVNVGLEKTASPEEWVEVVE